MAIFVSQVEAKSQTHNIVKSQNLTDFLRFRPNFFSHVKSKYTPECIHKFSRSKNNLAPFNSIRVLRAPPMNLSGPGGPWQIGLKKGERITSVGFGKISNFLLDQLKFITIIKLCILFIFIFIGIQEESLQSPKKSQTLLGTPGTSWP